MAAVLRQPVDRQPARFNCDPDVARRIACDLGIPQGSDWHEALLRRLEIDVRNLDTALLPREYPSEHDLMVEAATAADVDRLWPPSRLIENRTLEHAPALVRGWDESGVRPAVLLRTAGLFAMAIRFRGQTQAVMDLADENAVFLRIMDRIEQHIAEVIELAFRVLGDRLDIVYFADELGMQTGLMFSPRAIEKHFMPRFARLSQRIHRHGAKVFFHSCGAIEPVIADLVAAGVDILNPIQPCAPGMAPERLAERFGPVCFCGGIDMQRLLPFGTPDEVQQEVQRYIRLLAPGYIIDSANILHPDIPTANVLAMFTAPRTIRGATHVPPSQAREDGLP